MLNLSRINRFWRLSIDNDNRNNKHKSFSAEAEVEDSISLRVLVLGLVILGTVATDIASETSFSL